jgi:hypothetical protein
VLEHKDFRGGANLKRLAYAAVLMTIIPQAFGQIADNQCTFDTCKAGSKALTYYEKTDPYYSCPNRELAAYVTTIVGLLSPQAILVGQIPNFSDKTGPEYKGETKAMVDMLREKAGVQTFDQAVAICSIGVDKRPVMVLNMPDNSMVAYVEDERRKQTFWMPISHLDKLR